MSSSTVPEGKYADIGDGLRIHYHEEGPGEGAKGTLLFLHGSGPGASGWSNFKGNYPFFARRGYRVLLPDTLGYGYSSKPDNVDYTLDFLVAALRRFTDAVGAPAAALLGNSHGGAMAIGYALAHPERAQKLVLMAPGGLAEREAYMKMEGIRAMMNVFLDPAGITREGMRRVFGLQLFDPTQITGDLIEERFQIAETQPKRVLTSMRVPHLAPRLGEIQCPVFGWWGMDDRFCPVSGATILAESCKRSRVMLLSRCGHWVMVEHANLFNRLSLDFLEEP